MTKLQNEETSKVVPRNLDEEQEKEYEMISQLFNYAEISEADEFRIKRTKNTLYRGILVERKREGVGIVIYSNGRVYEGEWHSDKRNGRGYEVFSNNSTYLG